MIRLTCKSCGNRFHLPDHKIDEPAICPECGVAMAPLAPVSPERLLRAARADAGAGAATAAIPQVDDIIGLPDEPELSMQAPALPPPGHFKFDLSEPETGRDPHRYFPAYLEEELRSKNLLWIGAVIAAGFFAPIVGIPGQDFVIPELSGETGVLSGEMTGLALAIALLPLVGGVVVMALSRMVSPPTRGFGVTLVGASLFGLFCAEVGARELIGRSFSPTPTSVDQSLIMWMVGAFGLLTTTRTRWYRPIHKLGYVLGAIAGVCYITYLFVPVAGVRPLSQAFSAFRIDAQMGSAVLANIVFLSAAAVICIVNLPFVWNRRAAGLTRLAFFLLLLSLMIPVFIAMISMLFAPPVPGMTAMPFISAGTKYGIIFGGLVLLIPIGIADFLIGRAEPR